MLELLKMNKDQRSIAIDNAKDPVLLELSFMNGGKELYSIHNDPETKHRSYLGRPSALISFSRNERPCEVRFIRKSAIPEEYFEKYYKGDLTPEETY